MAEEQKDSLLSQKLSRRDFLKKAGLASAGALASGSLVGSMLQKKLDDKEAKHLGQDTIPFYDKHQAGILGPAQKSTYFVVLDLETSDRNKVIQMFKDWTAYAANLTLGKNVTEESSNVYLPPKDTGETLGLNPYRLTITFGVSRQFLTKLKLEHKIMPAFKDLPPFPTEQLEEAYTGGDIVIQACADDDQVAFHAVRNLIRKGRANVAMRWSQSGFLPIGDGKETPRNLFGFKDGTANVDALKKANQVIWHTDNDWLKNGSFMVVRKIRMHLETWDRTNLQEQENTFGRYKASGAPFGEKDEFAKVDIHKKDKAGNFVIPEDSHVHLAKKAGLEIYRRAYSYADGINSKTGQFEAGLLFICFQSDPKQFNKIQTTLGAQDRLNEYITHIGSGLFACFGGIREGEYIGQKLFE